MLLLISLALAREVPVPLTSLPPGVQATVETRWPGATLAAASRDGDDLDVEVRWNGAALEAVFDPAGAFRQWEQDVAVSAVPSQVLAAAGGRAKWAERITDAAGAVSWELGVGRREVWLREDGTPVE